MRFDDRFIDELKSRLRPSEVIGRSVKLKRQGREWVGLSPFNKERTPSFYVNDEKAFWHDFSSGKSGDVIGFLQETERLSFPEAVERLAAEAGLPLPSVDPRAAEQLRRQQSLSDWLETAAAWYEAELRRPGGQGARAYLAGRGLPAEEWGRFRLGYAPGGRTALKDYLVAKGATPAELVDAGLLIAPEGGGAPYDRFRDRVMFPITDGRGRLVSFGGRALDPEARAKYLNGPETALFHKGSQLYGLAEARKLLLGPPNPAGEGATADRPLVVVEGYFDAIACWRADVAAVAPLGTALTEEQMALLWRSHPEPTLCFDADKAGDRAVARAIERALPILQPKRSFRFARLEGGKDADDLFREQGRAGLVAQLQHRKPFAQQLFDVEKEKFEPLDTPELRAGLKGSLRKLAALIADKDLSQAYKQFLLRRYEELWTLKEPPRTVAGAARAVRQFYKDPKKMRWTPPTLPATAEGVSAARRLADSATPLQAALAIGILNHPEWIEDRLEIITVQGLGDPTLDELVAEVGAMVISRDPRAEALRDELGKRGKETLIQQIESRARLERASWLKSHIPEDERRVAWMGTYDAACRLRALERAIESAKADLERDRAATSATDMDPDTAVFFRLKAERDQLRNELRTGGLGSIH